MPNLHIARSTGAWGVVNLLTLTTDITDVGCLYVHPAMYLDGNDKPYLSAVYNDYVISWNGYQLDTGRYCTRARAVYIAHQMVTQFCWPDTTGIATITRFANHHKDAMLAVLHAAYDASIEALAEVGRQYKAEVAHG